MENEKLDCAVRKVLSEAQKLLCEKERIIIAADGRCGSGKSTFARKLSQEIDCNVICMDDFFLRPEQRTSGRYAEPGGNIDRERFLCEVLEKLALGETFAYLPFCCRTLSFGEPKEVVPKAVTIVEGSYSMHPDFSSFYDLCIFFDIEKSVQEQVIKKRNGDDAESFFKCWIPLEEAYFSAFGIADKCDFCFEINN